MNPMDESDVTLMFVKLLCVACVAVMVFAFMCWRLSRRKDDVVPVRRRKSWEVAFDKWLAQHRDHNLGRP